MKFNSESELFDYLEQHAYAGIISDILDENGYRAQVISPDCHIKPLNDDFVTVGRAVTMLNDINGDAEDPYKLVIECIDNIKPDSVLVTTGKVSLTTGIMGELTAMALRNRKVRGSIVNGYSRDLRKIKKMNFPTFAWGASPIDTTGRVRVIDYNITVEIGGVKIEPGMLIFADLDGIVTIPKEVEKSIISQIIERISVENLVRDDLEKGRKMREVWDNYQVL